MKNQSYRLTTHHWGLLFVSLLKSLQYYESTCLCLCICSSNQIWSIEQCFRVLENYPSFLEYFVSEQKHFCLNAILKNSDVIFRINASDTSTLKVRLHIIYI